MHPPPLSPGFPDSPASSLTSLDELAEIDNSLRQLDIETRRLEKKLLVVRDRTQRLRERRRLLVPTAPWIHRLPNEILAQILLKGTQPSYAHAHSSPQSTRRDRVKLPIAVSQVNRQWRSVALQIPRLWSYIDMREGRPYDRTLVWLKRSQGTVLDIDLDYRDQLDKPEAYFQRNFLITLNVILPTMNRWASLAIHAPTELVQTALHVFTSPAPMLHTLVLKGWRDGGPSGAASTLKDMPPTVFCSQTPRLKTVYLREVGLRWDTCIFSAMRELTLVKIPREFVPNVHQFARMVNSAASSLQRLTVIESAPRPVTGHSPKKHQHPNQPPPPEHVVLSRLTEMKLEDLEVHEMKMLVKLLVTPVLRRLSLARIFHNDAMDQDEEEDWRPQPLQYLSDLALSSVPLDTGIFQLICRGAPNIIRLRVDGGGDFTNSIISYLTPNLLLMLPDEEQMYLPRLAMLDMDEASADTVRSFIDSRTGSGGTLREVKGSILNEKRIKGKGVLRGEEAVRHLGWQKNENIQVAIQPTGQ